MKSRVFIGLMFTTISAFTPSCYDQDLRPSHLNEDSTPGQPPQIARFTVWLDKLDQDLLGVPVEEIPDRLVANRARASTFNVQALGRLYADQNPLFGTVLKKFKKLEDGIGEYQKWSDLTAEAEKKGSSEAVLTRLRTDRDNAKIALQKTLTTTEFVPADSTIVPATQQLRTALNAYPSWKDVATDRQDMLQKLIAELELIKSSQYDFTRLEKGNGVHEFRRKMRWYSMESRALNGMVSLKPHNSVCPVPSYASMITNSIAGTKYAVLPGSASEPDPILISPCLHIKVARLIEDVNQIKAKVEMADSLGEGEPQDLVSEADQGKLRAMLDDARYNRLFDLLQDELRVGLLPPVASPSSVPRVAP